MQYDAQSGVLLLMGNYPQCVCLGGVGANPQCMHIFETDHVFIRVKLEEQRVPRRGSREQGLQDFSQGHMLLLCLQCLHLCCFHKKTGMLGMSELCTQNSCVIHVVGIICEKGQRLRRQCVYMWSQTSGWLSLFLRVSFTGRVIFTDMGLKWICHRHRAVSVGLALVSLLSVFCLFCLCSVTPLSGVCGLHVKVSVYLSVSCSLGALA